MIALFIHVINKKKNKLGKIFYLAVNFSFSLFYLKFKYIYIANLEKRERKKEKQILENEIKRKSALC